MCKEQPVMKQFFAVLFLVAITCFAFAGCTNSNDQILSTENGSDTATDISFEQWTESKNPGQESITKMYITINGNKLEVTLAENSTVDALVELLKQGDIVYTANDYGDFEKVGSIGHTLPTNNSQITTQAGDVILYAGTQIVLFYGSNSWSYTKLGRINGYSDSELRTLLGAGTGSVQVTISLS